MLYLPKHFAAQVAAFFFALLAPLTAGAGAYEAHLPDDLATARDLCALVPCKDAFPGALGFSERMGSPPYVEAYGEPEPSGKKKLLGYVMLSTDITDTPAYSGKPVVTLIGMDTHGQVRRGQGAQALRTDLAARDPGVGTGQVQ